MPDPATYFTLVGLAMAVLAAAFVILFANDRRIARHDDREDSGLDVLDEEQRLVEGLRLIQPRQSISGHVTGYEPPVYVARSPLLGAKHMADQYAVHPPTFREGRHRAPLDTPRPAAASPLVHADTAVWEGSMTEQLARLLDEEIPFVKTVLRPEGNPEARWAQGLLFEAAR